MYFSKELELLALNVAVCIDFSVKNAVPWSVLLYFP